MASDLQEAFNVVDVESNGWLSSKDVALACRAMGANPTEMEMNEALSAVDMSSTGKFGFSEFNNVFGRLPKGKGSAAQADLLAAFKLFDKDSSGTIAGGELKYIMNTMGERLTEADSADVLKESGFTDDSRINYADLIGKMLAKAL